MPDERRLILEMLRDGTISVEDAERLLSALGAQSQSHSVPLVRSKGQAPQKILVLVTENGIIKVNIKVPFSLVKAGFKLSKSLGGFGAMYAKTEQELEILKSLQDIDLDQVLEMLDTGEITLPYWVVEADSDGHHAEVILE